MMPAKAARLDSQVWHHPWSALSGWKSIALFISYRSKREMECVAATTIIWARWLLCVAVKGRGHEDGEIGKQQSCDRDG
jgi:hypothetical protein